MPWSTSLSRPPRRWLLHVPLFAAVVAMIAWTSDRNAIWSPYYYITVHRIETQHEVRARASAGGAARAGTPPCICVKVNQFGYHFDGALDLLRYSPGTLAAGYISWLEPEYKLPYALTNGCDRILVVGAGRRLRRRGRARLRAQGTSTQSRSTQPSSGSPGGSTRGRPTPTPGSRSTSTTPAPSSRRRPRATTSSSSASSIRRRSSAP